MRRLLILTSLLLLCVGCTDTAGRQHQADKARQQQTADDLRELGLEMHNNEASESAADPTATDASEKTPKSPPDKAGQR
jgi:hypothetical protein